MEETYNQTSVCITPTHIYIPPDTYIYDLENNLSAYFKKVDTITGSLTFSAVLLGLCFVVYGLYSLVKTGNFSQVFVINLFISDLIQTSAKFIYISIDFLISRDLITITYYLIFRNSMWFIYFIGIMVNICFMVFICAQRYVMIAHPVWYRNIHAIRTSVIVSVTVWVILPIIGIITRLYASEYFLLLVVSLLPYPFVMFFFVGTWRALSRNTSVPRHEQRRIMGTLALVLGIYTVLFLPFGVIWIDWYFLIINTYKSWIDLVLSCNVLMALNPLFDFLLYLLMRRDAKDILRALFFCFRKRHEDNRLTETVTEAQV